MTGGHDVARDHALFRRFPLEGEAEISVGTVPTPYQVYDGHGIFVGGTADLAAVTQLLLPEGLVPVRTLAGRALMGVWLFDFREASLGPHHELQVSVFCTPKPIEPVKPHPLAILRLMLMQPDLCMLCHGLWNDSARVVAYNRELLALDAHVSRSVIERKGEELGFSVHGEADGNPLVHGRLAGYRRSSLRANLSLAGQVGWRRLASLAREPWIEMRIANPASARLERNAIALSYTHSDHSALRYFNPRRDQFQLAAEPYRKLGFEPDFVQSIEGFKFVYLAPT